MLSPLVVLAEVAAGSSAGDSTVGQLHDAILRVTDTFGVNLPSFLAQCVSFCVVAWVLWRFAFKPVLATINERQQTIESGLKYAEEMKAKLAATQQESAVIIKQAQVEATRIVDEARKTAKEFLDRQMQEAAVRANDALTKAQQAIELEHKKMLADARTEIARLVVSTTERVLTKKLSDTDRASYNDAATRELTGV
ncbi:MAG TPA: F0F1 ATP synthase subunit B [Opitutaceae bacterium]|nr:F0F1 ATP synthase subunit B [Opitutaceae bacterium]